MSAPEQKPDEQTLICAHENIEIDLDDPKCPRPTSQCSFRELCPVRDAIREIEKNK